MEKRKLSAIAREKASKDMMEIAGRLEGMRHIVTARLVEDNVILLLTFYDISDLAKGKEGAVFRTFLSHEDYITQDLRVEKVKWLTASFCMMDGFSAFESTWSKEKIVMSGKGLFSFVPIRNWSLLQHFLKNIQSRMINPFRGMQYIDFRKRSRL